MFVRRTCGDSRCECSAGAARNIHELSRSYIDSITRPSESPDCFDRMTSYDQVQSLNSIGEKPLAVIMAGISTYPPDLPSRLRARMRREWRDMQTDFLQWSSNSKFFEASNSGHQVQD